MGSCPSLALRHSRSVGQSSSARSLHVRDGNMGDGRTDGRADGRTRTGIGSPPLLRNSTSLARSLNWTRVGGVRSGARPSSSDTESRSCCLNESARAFFHVSNNLIPFVSLSSLSALLKSRLTRGHVVANTQSCCVVGDSWNLAIGTPLRQARVGLGGVLVDKGERPDRNVIWFKSEITRLIY